jgi:hypothetical protein
MYTMFQHPHYRQLKQTIRNVDTPQGTSYQTRYKKFRYTRYSHDVALIKLATSVDVSSRYVRTICLPPDGNRFNHVLRPPIKSPGNQHAHDAGNTESHNAANMVSDQGGPITGIDTSDCWVTGWGETKGKLLNNIDC